LTPVSGAPSGPTTVPLSVPAAWSVKSSATASALESGLMMVRALYLFSSSTPRPCGPIAMGRDLHSPRLFASLPTLAKSLSPTRATVYAFRGDAATHTTPGPGNTTRRYEPSGWIKADDAARKPFVILELCGLGKSG